jgi:hypothetical protein
LEGCRHIGIQVLKWKEEEKCEIVSQSMHALNDDILGGFLANDEFSFIDYSESRGQEIMLPDHRQGGAVNTNVSTVRHNSATMDSRA